MSGVIEKLSTRSPGEPSVPAVVFPINCSDPSLRLLTYPEFHSSEGIRANIAECAAGRGVTVVIGPSSEQVVEGGDLISNTRQRGSTLCHVLDLALQLHHAFLRWV